MVKVKVKYQIYKYVAITNQLGKLTLFVYKESSKILKRKGKENK